MVISFEDFYKKVGDKIKDPLTLCIMDIDDFLSRKENISQFIKSGELYFNLRKNKSLWNYCQSYTIQKQLHELYFEKGWQIRYSYPFLSFLSIKNRIIGITFRKCHVSLVK